MTTGRPEDITTVTAGETTQAQEGAAAQPPHHRAWYRFLNEDWLATLFGLLLVLLLVVGLLHAIP